MVVCKFFQQGYCRFAQNCKFEHVYPSKYSYRSNQQQQPAAHSISDEQLMAKVITDVQAALRGNQWMLSSYSPFNEKPGFPGLTDLSPEEARLFIYEAKAKNNVDQAVNYMNHLTKEALKKYEQLTQPTPKILQTLRSLFNGEAVTQSPFPSSSHSSSMDSTAASVFRSAVQSTSIFGQPSSSNSVFGSQPTSNTFGSSSGTAQSIFAQENQSIFGPKQETKNVFGAQSPTNAASIFASASQSLFGTKQSPFQQSNQSVFGQSNNVFAQANPTQSTNVFALNTSSPFSQTTASSPFAQTTACSPFAQNAASPFQTTSSSPFSGTPFAQSQQSGQLGTGNIFGQQPVVNDTGIYSEMEELTQEDIEIYQANEFKLGFVPMHPPPKSLCTF